MHVKLISLLSDGQSHADPL